MSKTIKHHPDSATLMAYAAATLPEPLAAVVSAHLAMCPHCRAEVADMELIGSALLTELPSDVFDDAHACERAVELVAADDGGTATLERAAAPARAGNGLPAPIASVYGLSLEDIPWRRLGPGIWHHRLSLRDADSGDLRLLKVAPGRALPDHGHGGSELTLVIEGSYSDVTGCYQAGDIQDVDETVEHQPIVGKERDCICLIASESPARFKSRISRLLQPLTGM